MSGPYATLLYEALKPPGPVHGARVPLYNITIKIAIDLNKFGSNKKYCDFVARKK